MGIYFYGVISLTNIKLHHKKADFFLFRSIIKNEDIFCVCRQIILKGGIHLIKLNGFGRKNQN